MLNEGFKETFAWISERMSVRIRELCLKSQGHRKHSETLVSCQSIQYDWSIDYTEGLGEK